ncbi:MAG: sigma-70 family RNA polymerase sigma factor [Chitinophagales bacterium]|nr:sigma-70 family RNA polymerase sigma factor [Chitinophagales bacterium]
MNTEQLFIQTINQHQGIIHKVCRMYCSGQEDHHDLFQEIVLQLWKAFPGFRQESKISTWMYRIALNTAISGLRKKKIQTTGIDAIAFQLEDRQEENPEVGLQQLYKAIEHLSDVEKSIVLLYLEDKPYDEIAEITGITANYVAVKMNRIKEKLRTILNVRP